MSVSSRFAVLSLTMLACSPRTLEAAPFLVNPSGAQTQGLECTGLVPNLSACGLFSIDPFAGPITGGLVNDNDVALFQFLLTTQTFFAATTALGGFDASFGLFDQTGRILEYVADPLVPDARYPARSEDVSFDGVVDDTLSTLVPVLLLDPGTYFLALLQNGNFFKQDDVELVDMLGAGFSGDDGLPFGGCAETGTPCGFALSITATPVNPAPAPVPEPGTLSLLILGSAAAVLRRRRKSESRS